MELKLPKLSATMEEGTIVEWIKREGDAVREGEVLYLVETDKATLEVESTVNGVLEKIFVQPHVPVPAKTPVCLIRTDEEPGAAQPAEEGEQPPLGGKAEDERLKVSPAGRKKARELGVDLAKVIGTGPNGRIVIKDIEDAAKLALSPPSQAAQEEEKASERLAGRKPASVMRAAIARSMTASWTTIPTFWVEKWVCVEKLLQAKELLGQSRNEAYRGLTVTDFLLQAVVSALSEMPELNVRWTDDGQIEEIAEGNVGLAIRLDEGLVAPVLALKDRSLLDIARSRAALVEAVRANKPYADDLQAAITLSNLGPMGIDRFRAIVKPGESMILAAGKMEDKVLAENGQVVIRKGIPLVLSADHRIIDGSEAARLLAGIGGIIESGHWKYA